MNFKLLGWAVLAAVLGMALIGVSGASASEPTVTTEGGGAATFTSKGTTGVTLEVVPEGTTTRVVSCTASSGGGEFNTTTTEKFGKMVFTGCTATGPFGKALTCSSGSTGGEIATVALKATVSYLKMGDPEAGLVLEPESGTTIATFSCGSVESITVKGAFIGKITPVNTLTKTFNLKLAQKGGHQEPEVFLSSTGCKSTVGVLTASGTGNDTFSGQAGIAMEQTLTFAKGVDITSTKCT